MNSVTQKYISRSEIHFNLNPMALKALLQEIRPLNAALSALSVWIGYYFSAGLNAGSGLYLACLAAALICAGGNIWNDYFDYDIDVINKPVRPYAAGLISGKMMVYTGTGLLLAGMGASVLINIQTAAIAVSAVVVVMAYNFKIKRIVLAGNVLIALLTGLVFLFGAAAGGGMHHAVIPAVLAGTYHLGREILKDIEDREGDNQQKIITFPAKYGNTAALSVASAVFGTLILLTFIPYVNFDYSIKYLLVVLAGVDIPIVVLVGMSWKRQESGHMRRINASLKIGMVFGLMALLLK